MTRTDRRGSPILDGVETAVAAARGAVSSATRSAFHRGLAQTFTPPDEFRRSASPLEPDGSSKPHSERNPGKTPRSAQPGCRALSGGTSRSPIRLHGPLPPWPSPGRSSCGTRLSRRRLTPSARGGALKATPGAAVDSRTVPSTLPSSQSARGGKLHPEETRFAHTTNRRHSK